MATIATMAQKVFTAKEAKNNFGRLLDEARRSPVAIKKNGRKVAFVISQEDYSDYEDFESIIDANWGKRAIIARKEGYLSVRESKKFIESILNEIVGKRNDDEVYRKLKRRFN